MAGQPPAGRVLIIAWSDSGGGAGIQGDIKTVSALGGYAMTAITALTAQNTQGVFGIHPIPEAFIAQQIALCLEDIGADAIKTGMLHSAGVIEAVVDSLDEVYAPFGAGAPPLVVDPVMVAKGGAALLEGEALKALKTLLIPRAALITPNLPEAALLLGRPIRSDDADGTDMTRAAEELLALGAQAVLLKGGHGSGTVLTDILVTRDSPAPLILTAPRRATRHTHGTGCAFASAIATGLAQQLPLEEAVTRAHAYVQGAIARAPGFGAGNGPLGH
ncbi:MAG: bifunctional hydroxymethylpyrimidine kinase/phosphomethylpyrimidine kinase [Alphaproteobacteria bacterium]|nr:bifunctional hydroxymethylpyrimidine kinase/phosphomethylpyrimidine kinase [Alphaproteobacteria bacterium]